MDNGSEFTSNRFKHLLANNGILENLIPPGDHAQNGRVERQHLTILNTVRTILIDSKLPQEFWAEAANYVVHVRNRIPNAKTRKIPYTMWSGKNVAHETLRPFGSQIYFRDHTESDKLQA
jgi:transposase InsO family protein